MASYSPTGKKILYQAEMPDKSGELRVYNTESRQITPVTKTAKSDVLPSWSPDGEWIVFQNFIEGNTEICLVKPDGSGLRNLTQDQAKDLFPAWSPDGKQIVFASNRGSGSDSYSLYLMNIDGSDLHLVYQSSAISVFPNWSADGHEIVFANDKEDNRSGNFEIFSFSPGSDRSEKRLTFRRRVDTMPAFSPDGKKIVYVSEGDGNPEIYLMNADGSGALRLTRDPGIDTFPRWSPDGRKIIFISDRGGRASIYEIEIP